MTQPKLKPCPFCGGEASAREHHTHLMGRIECNNDRCWARPHTGYFTDPEHAGTAWNTRDTGQSDRMAALLRKWAATEGPGNSIALWAERDELLREIEG